MNEEGFIDYSLFELIDTVIRDMEQRVSDLEWGFSDEIELENLRLRLELLCVRRDSGEAILPRF